MPKRLTIEDVKKLLKSKGYSLLSKEYKNAFGNLEVECSNGHRKNTTLSKMYKNQKCYKCVDRGKFSINEIRKIFKKENYILISNTYNGAREYLDVKCPNGHSWSVSVNKFKDRNQRCPRCTFLGGNSKMENDLMDAIRQVYPSAKKSKIRNIKIPNKSWVRGFDLDIFIPELKKAIEFDGTYFHSIEGLKRGYPNWPLQDLKRYHIIKDAYFSSLGIQVLHIKEKEWLKDKEKCIDKCLKFLRK